MTLASRIRVLEAERGDAFVGFNINEYEAVLSLPMGMSPPKTVSETQKLARKLVRLLRALQPSAYPARLGSLRSNTDPDEFPFEACTNLIFDYLETGEVLWTVSSERTRTGRGRIDWPRTFKRVVPFGSEGGEFVFTQFVRHQSIRKTNNPIAQLHRTCLTFAFDSIGWLFTDLKFDEQGSALPKEIALSTLENELAQTYNDRRRRILSSILQIIEFKAPSSVQAGHAIYGTEHFEYVWEKMIDSVFGNADKSTYFPKAQWILEDGTRTPSPLEIDTVMNHDGQMYILDAKYYRFGLTEQPIHLPGTADINKQVTYGQMAYRVSAQETFNAFLLPFKSPSLSKHRFERFGVAVPTWLNREPFSHEKIVGIFVDTEALIDWFFNPTDAPAHELASTIRDALR